MLSSASVRVPAVALPDLSLGRRGRWKGVRLVGVLALLSPPFFFGGEDAFLGGIALAPQACRGTLDLLMTYMLCKALPS